MYDDDPNFNLFLRDAAAIRKKLRDEDHVKDLLVWNTSTRASSPSYGSIQRNLNSGTKDLPDVRQFDVRQ